MTPCDTGPLCGWVADSARRVAGDGGPRRGGAALSDTALNKAYFTSVCPSLSHHSLLSKFKNKESLFLGGSRGNLCVQI